MHRAEALAFYESIIQDPEIDIRTKMWAQERIDTILGLNTGLPDDDGEDGDGPTVYGTLTIVPPGTPPDHPSPSPGLIEEVDCDDEG